MWNVLLFFVPLAQADDWLCKTQAAERYGSSVVVCGIGESDTEARSRQIALDNAQIEFHSLCADSADCRDRLSVLVPLRSTCEQVGRSVRCYRALRYEIGSKVVAVAPVSDREPAGNPPVTVTQGPELVPGTTHYFPKAVVKEIENIQATNLPVAEKLRRAKSAICDGPKARFKIVRDVSYIPPITKGLPKDEAEEYRKQVRADTLDYLAEQSLFESSGQPYTFGFYGAGEKEQAETLRSLYSPQAEDIGLLVKAFTVQVPLGELHLSDQEPASFQYFGYTPEGKVSMRLLIDNRDSIWEYVLAKGTKVTDQGSMFHMETSLDAFCLHGASALDLIEGN